MTPRLGSVVPAALLGLLLMALFTATRQEGIVFSPAEVDFLFSGPFTRRQLLFYKLFAGAPGRCFWRCSCRSRCCNMAACGRPACWARGWRWFSSNSSARAWCCWGKGWARRFTRGSASCSRARPWPRCSCLRCVGLR